MMNKDEIQQLPHPPKPLRSCGLVMNKDEIQLATVAICCCMCCGLVMNKDEIQQHSADEGHGKVVVW